MGFPKPMLPFGAECMLQRVVRLLATALPEVVVAAGADQELPELPPSVSVVRDRHADRGPLEGLYAGLAHLPAHIDAAYVTGCDVPLLLPAFALRMIELLGDNQIAVPVHEGYHYPLAAVYRRSVLGSIEGLLAAGRLRPAYLFDLVPTRRVPVAQLRDVDPELLTLENINHPPDYLKALAQAGFAAPPEVLAVLSANAS